MCVVLEPEEICGILIYFQFRSHLILKYFQALMELQDAEHMKQECRVQQPPCCQQTGMGPVLAIR